MDTPGANASRALPTWTRTWGTQTSFLGALGGWVGTRMQRGRVPRGEGVKDSGAVLGGFMTLFSPCQTLEVTTS